MGIGLEDILGAVGAGMERAGEIKQEDKKTQLANKLEQEREARAEQRQIDREKRQELRDAGKVSRTEMSSKEGVLYERDYNANGDLINERLADPMKVKQVQQDEQNRALTLEGKLLDLDQDKKKLGRMDEEWALDREYKQSAIDENRAQAERARRPDKDKNEPKDDSLPALTSGLLKEYQDLVKSYIGTEITGPDGETREMTMADARDVARESIRFAARDGNDARVVFEDALKRFGKKRTKGK